jgi:hypothetical protein
VTSIARLKLNKSSIVYVKPMSLHRPASRTEQKGPLSRERRRVAPERRLGVARLAELGLLLTNLVVHIPGHSSRLHSSIDVIHVLP